MPTIDELKTQLAAAEAVRTPDELRAAIARAEREQAAADKLKAKEDAENLARRDKMAASMQTRKANIERLVKELVEERLAYTRDEHAWSQTFR